MTVSSHSHRLLWTIVAVIVLLCAARLAGADTPTVVVAVDMDAARPGIQQSLLVRPGTTRVEDITVWVFDESESAFIYAVGYLGGLDRSLAFGHAPQNSNSNVGAVTGVEASVGGPIVADNAAFVTLFTEKLFIGPEVQYVEWGETGGVVPASPTAPILEVAVDLADTSPGDVFRFYVGDNVSVWTGGQNGLFSTQTPWSLDTGGDHVPDGTPTVAGVDADTAIPVPTGAFFVDFQDGPNAGGGATIIIAALSDLNLDGNVDLNDFAEFATCFNGAENPPAAGCTVPADLDGDGDVDLNDFAMFAGAYSN